MTIATLLPVTLFLRGSTPIEQLAPAKIQWRLTRTPLAGLLGVVVVLQGAVNYLPSSFLPVYAADVGLSSLQQAFLLASLNVALIPGQAIFGWLASVTFLSHNTKLTRHRDTYGSYFPLLLGSILTSVSVIFLW